MALVYLSIYMCFYPLFWNGFDIDGGNVNVEEYNFINKNNLAFFQNLLFAISFQI